MPTQQQQPTGAFDIQPTQATGGPFDQYLDPVATATHWDQGKQPSGWGHKASGIAYLGTQLLQGITNGRVRAYAKKERERLQTLGNMNQLYEETMQSDIDPAAKEQLRTLHGQLLSGEIQKQLRDSGALKDKGQRGKFATMIGNLTEHLSGVPADSKTDPITVESMSKFMGMLAQAKATAKPATTAYQDQFSLIQQGIEDAKKNVQGKWTQPTQEQILASPKVRQALGWFQQYAPHQMPLATQMLQGYPSQTNLKERAGAELASGVGAPPNTQARSVVQTGAPPQTAPPAQQPATAGYTANQYPAGPPTSATPPQTAKPTAADQEEDEWKAQLGQWAGVQQDAPIFDRKGEIVGYGPKTTALAIAANNREMNLSDSRDRAEADKKDQAKQRQDNWEKTQARLTKQSNENFTEKERSQARADNALAYRKSHDATVLAQAKTSEEKALNDFIADATANGHSFGVVADNIEDYLDKYGPETEIGKNKAYIIGQVAAIKNKQAGGNWMSFFGGGTAPPNTAKPAGSAAPPRTAAPAPDIKKQVNDIKSAIE